MSVYVESVREVRKTWSGLRNRLHAWAEESGRTDGRVDRWVLFLTLGLVCFGMVMVYSASAVVAAEDTGDALYFFKRQAAAVVVGLAGMGALAWVPTRFIRRHALVLYVASTVGLVMVFIPGFGHAANGATRWLGFGSVHIQPSEFAKVALILTLGGFVSRHPGMMDDIRRGILPCLALATPIILLTIMEPDFGTTAILAGIVGLVLLFGGLPGRWILSLGVIAAGAVVPLVALSGYRMGRLRSWLDPWAVAETDGYQVIQSWVALYSGGWTGQGLGNSLAKLRFLPEPWTDFVAAVVGEELGFIGILCLMTAYGLFIWRGILVARQTRSYFGMLVAACITVVLGVQALLNLAVVLGMVPPKGLVLPFVSYGGSAIIAQLWSVGILLSISMERKQPSSAASGPGAAGVGNGGPS